MNFKTYLEDLAGCLLFFLASAFGVAFALAARALGTTFFTSTVLGNGISRFGLGGSSLDSTLQGRLRLGLLDFVLFERPARDPETLSYRHACVKSDKDAQTNKLRATC